VWTLRRAGLCALAALTACSSGGSGGPASEAPRAAPDPSRVYAVGRLHETFVDDSRPTAPNGDFAGAPERTLETLVYYPATGAPGGPVHDGAPAALDDGPYPLVVFVHGFTGTAIAYANLLAHVASEGYVVVAPDEPLTSRHAPGGPALLDVHNQPGDVSFLVTAMSRRADGAGPLGGLVDTGRVGVAGHSLGAITTLLASFNSCCLEPRIDAAVALAGAAVIGPPGGRWQPAGPGDAGPVPLLMVNAGDDALVTLPLARTTYGAARQPKAFVTLVGAEHSAPFLGAAPWFDVVGDVAVDWFDAYVTDLPEGLTRLRADADVPGVATLEADVPEPVA
jgi:dienelactone hydrolase